MTDFVIGKNVSVVTCHFIVVITLSSRLDYTFVILFITVMFVF